MFLLSFGNALVFLPITLNPSAWYGSYSLVFLLTLIALAVYGFYISLAGRPVFSEKLLEAEARGKP